MAVDSHDITTYHTISLPDLYPSLKLWKARVGTARLLSGVPEHLYRTTAVVWGDTERHMEDLYARKMDISMEVKCKWLIGIARPDRHAVDRFKIVICTIFRVPTYLFTFAIQHPVSDVQRLRPSGPNRSPCALSVSW